jgi:transcriptional regulator with XRE-family HTH domain
MSIRGVQVTVHAARKWLLGEAIPTQDKLQALAAWLGVEPNWLRFGVGSGEGIAPAAKSMDPVTLRLLSDYEQLAERDQQLVRAMVWQMRQQGREVAA